MSVLNFIAIHQTAEIFHSKPQTHAHADTEKKSHEITKVRGFHCLETVNISTKFSANVLMQTEVAN